MLTKINIAQKLHAIAEKNATDGIIDSERLLESVTGHLASTDEETLKMLDLFATSKQVKEVKSKVESSKTVLAEKYVTTNDIKNVCVKYNLRFLPVRMYAKPVPFSALDDLRKFKETFAKKRVKPATTREDMLVAQWRISIMSSGENLEPQSINKEEHKYFHEDRLFIIAPASHFTTIHEPVQRDPVICYNLGEGNYKVVTKFGNDFTQMRRVSGFIANNPIKLIMSACLLIAIVGFYFLIHEVFGAGIPLVAVPFFGAMVTFVNYYDILSISDKWNNTIGIKRK